jgi:hypothetical protein
MRRNWENLPNSYFVGKFVNIGLAAYEPKLRAHIKELIWIKVTGSYGNWLVGEIDDEPRLRQDTKRGDVILFAKQAIDKILGVSE